jgi:hypothetical protein
MLQNFINKWKWSPQKNNDHLISSDIWLGSERYPVSIQGRNVSAPCSIQRHHCNWAELQPELHQSRDQCYVINSLKLKEPEDPQPKKIMSPWAPPLPLPTSWQSFPRVSWLFEQLMPIKSQATTNYPITKELLLYSHPKPHSPACNIHTLPLSPKTCYKNSSQWTRSTLTYCFCQCRPACITTTIQKAADWCPVNMPPTSFCIFPHVFNWMLSYKPLSPFLSSFQFT